MLLAIDIGNSSVKFGIFENNDLLSRFSIPTVRTYTAAEISALVENRLTARPSSIVVSSVVPELNESFRSFGLERFGAPPFFVTNDFDFGFGIRYFPPGSIGTDRLIAAFGAVEKYGRPCIVCDFGTATTIDAVNSKNVYLGGIITTGIETLSEALFLKTSKLPRVEIKKPEHVIGNSTVSSIQSGIFHGYIGLTEGILRKMTAELGENPRIIATGGSARLIAESCALIETVDETLVLDALRIIHERAGKKSL